MFTNMRVHEIEGRA